MDVDDSNVRQEVQWKTTQEGRKNHTGPPVMELGQ